MQQKNFLQRFREIPVGKRKIVYAGISISAVFCILAISSLFVFVKPSDPPVKIVDLYTGITADHTPDEVPTTSTDTSDTNESTISEEREQSSPESTQETTISQSSAESTSSAATTTTTTAPESPSAYVAFYADNQSDSDADDANHQRAVNYILSRGANPIFHAGNVMEDGTQDSLDRFNSVTATLRATRTFYAALGNNDRKVGDPSTPSQLFLDNFVFPGNERWYSVNFGNLHIVILDSAFAAGSATQQAWLASDLQSSASQDRITGVVFHHPEFTTTVLQKLIDYGGDFIVAGHWHSYQHTIQGGVHRFVMSGQPSIGYMTAIVYEDHVSFTVYNHNNAVIETVTVNDR